MITNPPVARTVTGIWPCQRIAGFIGSASPGITGMVSTVVPSTITSMPVTSIHVGACKVMYADYAFGSASLRFATPEVEPWQPGEAEMAAVLPWLERVHGDLVRHVEALTDDDELDAERLTNWGERRPTRWIVAAMITHDGYHAGEVNHLRSLLGDDDRWRFQQLGYG